MQKQNTKKAKNRIIINSKQKKLEFLTRAKFIEYGITIA